uniref:Uncharacterized protein n=1 Tax=viral metagenome TaxID=1070528 RepID=A0A6C0C7V4_9ZZZZ
MPRYPILIYKLFLINKIIKHPDISLLLKKELIQLQFRKIVLISNPQIIEQLFEHARKDTHFHHIKFNGLSYYETTNIWMSHKIVDRPEYDPDIPCTSHRRCEHEPMIYPICTDKIKYILKEGYEGKKMKDELQISQCKLSNVLLVGFNNLTIRNDCGKNKDHRGSNHCNIFLPMNDRIVIKDMQHYMIWRLPITN